MAGESAKFRARVALVAVILGLTVLYSWFRTDGAKQPATPKSESALQKADSILSEVAARDEVVGTAPSELPSGAERVAGSENLVLVKSALGLPLDGLRVKQSTSKAWRNLGGPAATTITLDAADEEREIRAAGHLVRRIPPGPGSYELETDSVLIFAPSSPNDELVWLDWLLEDRRSFQGAATATAAVIGDEFVIAADAESPQVATDAGRPIQWKILLGSGWLIDGAWAPAPRSTIRQELGAEYCGQRARGVLSATLTSGGLAPEKGDGLSWKLHLVDPPVKEERIRIPVSWGALTLRRLLAWSELSLFAAQGAQPRFENVFMGAHYELTVRSADWSLVGFTAFQFDGQAVEIDPQLGRLFVAQFIDQTTGAPIADAPVRLDFRYGDDSCRDGFCAWNGHVMESSDADGRVHFSGLTKTPGRALVWPPPRTGRMSVEMAGFEPRSIRLVWDPHLSAECDIGRVELSPRTAELVLPAVFSNADTLWLAKFGDGTPGGRSFDIHAWSMTDAFGANAWGIQPGEDEDVKEFRLAVEATKLRHAGLLLKAESEQVYAYQFVDDEWREVECRLWEMEVSLGNAGEDAAPLRVGYSWAGVDLTLGYARPIMDNSWRFRAPWVGAQLWSERSFSHQPPLRTDLPLQYGQSLELR